MVKMSLNISPFRLVRKDTLMSNRFTRDVKYLIFRCIVFVSGLRLTFSCIILQYLQNKYSNDLTIIQHFRREFKIRLDISDRLGIETLGSYSRMKY